MRGVRHAPGDDAGGIGGLYRLLTEHGEAIEADLQRYYAIALSELFTGRLSWRRLGVLVRGLPPGSALSFATEGSDAAWGLPEQLLATIADTLAAANWQRSNDRRQPRPRPIQRPGVIRPNEQRMGSKSMTVDEYRRHRAERRARKLAHQDGGTDGH